MVLFLRVAQIQRVLTSYFDSSDSKSDQSSKKKQKQKKHKKKKNLALMLMLQMGLKIHKMAAFTFTI